MPNNKKKNKQKKKSNGGSAVACKSNDGDANNARVLESLIRLAAALAQLDETRDDDAAPDDSSDGAAHADGAADLVAKTAAMEVDDGEAAAAASPSENDDAADSSTPPATTAAPPPPPKSTLAARALPLSHWRTLPPHVTSAYRMLDDGAEYVHATSTKYALVGKIDLAEGGKLALELRRGAESIGAAALLLFSPSCGSSRSLRRYVKQSSRAVLASTVALVRSFEDGEARGEPGDGNEVGARRTGAVWSACEGLTRRLPRGNRAAMRRELMLWARDCNESVEEFEEVLEAGPLGEDAMDEEEKYAERETGAARASVNVMKCSKNLLGLVLKTCECVGERADELTKGEDLAEAVGEMSIAQSEHGDDGAQTKQTQQKRGDDDKRREMLQWISNLHEMARTVGEGVTNFGILLYPPLDTANHREALEKWQARKPERTIADEYAIPSLGSTALGLQLEHQLCALSECVESVHEARLPVSGESIRSCLSQEVVEGVEKLRKAVRVRCREVEEAIVAWGQDGSSK